MEKTFKQNTLTIALSLVSTQTAQRLCTLCTVGTLALTVTAMQPAQGDTYQSSVTHTHTTSKVKTYLQTHPKVKKAAIGAGVGTAAGAAVGLISGKGVLRGAAIGAGTGATVGAISGSKTLRAHPYMKDMAEGTLGGAGLSLAMNKGHGKGKRVAEGAALGAAAGLATGFLKKELQ